MNRQVNGDGTGALAYWTAADNTLPAVTVDDNLGNGNSYAYDAVGPTSISCDLVDATDHTTLLNTGALSVVRGARVAASFDIAVTGGTVAGTADGDYLVHRDSARTEMVGIQGVISNANP